MSSESLDRYWPVMVMDAHIFRYAESLDCQSVVGADYKIGVEYPEWYDNPRHHPAPLG